MEAKNSESFSKGKSVIDLSTLSLPNLVNLPSILKELSFFEGGKMRVDIEEFTKRLHALPQNQLVALSKCAVSYIARINKTSSEKGVNPEIVHALFAVLRHLEFSGYGEKAELLYERLLPAAEKSGDRIMTAWLHVAVAMVNVSVGDDEAAYPHFRKAYEIFKNTDYRFHLISLPIYEFFAQQALGEATQAHAFDEQSMQNISYWCSRVMSVVGNPINKHPSIAASHDVLRALEVYAEIQAVIEREGGNPFMDPVQAFERLGFFAAVNPDPCYLARARLRLSTVYLEHGKLQEAFSEAVWALDEVRAIENSAAQEVRKLAVARIHALTEIGASEGDEGMSSEGE